MVSKSGVEDPTFEAKDSKKNPRPRSSTDFSRTDPLGAKDKNARGQRQNFFKLWWANFQLFSSAKVFKIIAFL